MVSLKYFGCFSRFLQNVRLLLPICFQGRLNRIYLPGERGTRDFHTVKFCRSRKQNYETTRTGLNRRFYSKWIRLSCCRSDGLFYFPASVLTQNKMICARSKPLKTRVNTPEGSEWSSPTGTHLETPGGTRTPPILLQTKRLKTLTHFIEPLKHVTTLEHQDQTVRNKWKH